MYIRNQIAFLDKKQMDGVMNVKNTEAEFRYVVEP